MKQCEHCNIEVEDGADFCPICGQNALVVKNAQENQTQNCPYCNTVIQQAGGAFCPHCGGTLLSGQTRQSASDATSVVQNMKTTTNAFLQSVKSDFQSSKAVDMVKKGAKSTIEKAKTAKPAQKKKGIIVASVVAAVLVVLLIVTNIHTCPECDEVYFGSRKKISFFDETEYVCKDCYEDFYGFY